MIKFIIEYLKLLGKIIGYILLAVSVLFSVFGPVAFALAYETAWLLLLYILTIPYISILIKQVE
jgi:hypothetical protein